VRTCIIFNPSARGQKAERLCSRLAALCPNSVLRRTNLPGDGRALAAQAVREGFTTIIAAGGDGTANEVVNGIAEASGGLEIARLGLFPLGTINVFARELGLPRNIADMAQVLLAGQEIGIDLGRVEFPAAGGSQTRYFLQLAGAGLDSRAVELVDWELKKKIGRFAYVIAGLRALQEKQPLITVEYEKTIAGELVLLGNGRLYGGDFEVFPRASLHDGLLDVCVLPKISAGQVLRIALGVITGRLHRFSAARHSQSSRVKLSSASRVTLQLDGENVCPLPATFSVLPKALRVIVP
jgi:YegS/Rv2252/BmrU family lipid kinase